MPQETPRNIKTNPALPSPVEHNMQRQEDSLNMKILSSFDGGTSGPSLSTRCFDLLTKQKSSWPELSAGIAALENVNIRELPCNGYSVKLQFNPARMKSSVAAVDPQSISKRPCFLCLNNLPEAQKGVLYRQTFLILCNPFPILTKHYTVSHIDHIPQSFAGTVSPFLKLAKDLSPDFSILYNGPQSGASAPDHLHFQAAPVCVLPIEKEIRTSGKLTLLKSIDGISLSKAKNMGREAIMIEGKNPDVLEAALLKIIDGLKTLIPTPDEPMMNIHCSYRENLWYMLIFLRRKHRPDVYFLEGDKQILISPGVVDMGGLVITPVEKDFNAIDSAMMEGIYREISLDTELIERVISSL
jgi:hypothetical protein